MHNRVDRFFLALLHYGAAPQQIDDLMAHEYELATYFNTHQNPCVVAMDTSMYLNGHTQQAPEIYQYFNK